MSTGPAGQEDQTSTVMKESPGTPSSAGSAVAGGCRSAGTSAKSDANVLECFICMEPPPDPVAASCGHVFCWSCLSQWLQNQAKPCPVCRHLLRRDFDIIPLYGAGDQARAGPSVTSNSPGESPVIPGSGRVMIPPRPRNPLVIEASATPENLVRLMPTPNSVLAAYERSVLELSAALVEERMRARHLTTERAHLELEVEDREQRNAALRRQVQDTDCQIFVLQNRRMQLEVEVEVDLKERNARLEREVVERRERDQGLVQRKNEMGAQIARLQQRLARAQSLPGSLV